MALAVGAHSRYTVNVDEPVVLAMYHSGDGTAGYQASLTVQTTDKSVFVAERPLYWATWAANSQGRRSARRTAWRADREGGRFFASSKTCHACVTPVKWHHLSGE